MATISFTTTFDLTLSPKQFIWHDTTDWAGQGISTAYVNGCFKIISPSGIVYYNNVDFSNLGCDIDIQSSLTSKLVVQLPNLSGVVEQGTYIITYSVFNNNTSETYTLTKTYTYSYASPTVAISLTADCISPLINSTDITVYNKVGASVVISREQTLYYPNDSTGQGQFVTTSGVSIIQNLFYPGQQTTKIVSGLVYTFTVGLIVNDSVTGVKDLNVDCQDVCAISCCVANAETKLENYKTSNPARYDEFLPDVLLAGFYMGAIRYYIFCGKNNKVNGELDKIKSLLKCTNECNCSDEISGPVVGLGGTFHTVVNSAGYPFEVTSSVAGTTTTYTGKIAEDFVNKVNSLAAPAVQLDGVFVDSVFGNDATAEKYNLLKPYKSLTAATTAATTGDEIIAIGSFTNFSLGKDGITYNLLAATITPSSGNAFDDEDTSMTYNVIGTGRIITVNGCALQVGGANSKISLTCNYAESNGSSASTIYVSSTATDAVVTVNSETDIYQKGSGEAAVRV